MTLRPALARLERGFKRLWGKAVEWCWERPQAAFARQTLLQWRSQKRRTREMLAEADTAVMAARLDTVDGDAQVSIQRPAFNDEIERLLKTPKRTPEEERRLFWLQRKVREIDELVATRGVSPATFGARRLAEFGAVGRRRFFAAPAVLALGGVRPWMIWTGLVSVLALLLGFQSVRVGSLKVDLREAHEQTQAAEEAAQSWRERSEEYAQAVTDARQVAQQTADALDAERRARQRAAAADRRRQREIQDVLTNSPDAPSWSLRDDGTSQ